MRTGRGNGLQEIGAHEFISADDVPAVLVFQVEPLGKVIAIRLAGDTRGLLPARAGGLPSLDLCV